MGGMWTGIRCGTEFTVEVVDPNVDGFGVRLMCPAGGRRTLHKARRPLRLDIRDPD